MKEFVHLHTHTEYSLLDGAAKIKELVEAVKAQGASAVAITDHGNLYGAIKFYNVCKKEGIKPIIGCEFYVTNDTMAPEEAPTGRTTKAIPNIILFYWQRTTKAFITLSSFLQKGLWTDFTADPE